MSVCFIFWSLLSLVTDGQLDTFGPTTEQPTPIPSVVTTTPTFSPSAVTAAPTLTVSSYGLTIELNGEQQCIPFESTEFVPDIYDNYHEIGWIKIMSCTEATTTFTDFYNASVFAPYATSIKFQPPGGTSHASYYERTIIGKVNSNPIIALNDGFETTWQYDAINGTMSGLTDINNWLTYSADANSTIRAVFFEEPYVYQGDPPRTLNYSIFQGMGNPQGFHVMPGESSAAEACLWRWSEVLGIDIEVLFGFQLLPCFDTEIVSSSGYQAAGDNCNCGNRVQIWRSERPTHELCAAACSANYNCMSFGSWDNNSCPTGYCALFDAFCPGDDGWVNDTECFHPTLDPDCPNTVYNKIVTVSEYVVVTESMNYSSALEHCRDAFGTDLASMHHIVDYEEAKTACESAGNGLDCWIGLNDQQQEGNWTWTDGSSFNFGSNLSASPWQPGEPNNNGAGQHCAKMHLPWNYTWDDYYCYENNMPLCNAPLTTAPSTEPTAAPTEITTTPTFSPSAVTAAPSADPTAYPTHPTYSPTKHIISFDEWITAGNLSAGDCEQIGGYDATLGAIKLYGGWTDNTVIYSFDPTTQSLSRDDSALSRAVEVVINTIFFASGNLVYYVPESAPNTIRVIDLSTNVDTLYANRTPLATGAAALCVDANDGTLYTVHGGQIETCNNTGTPPFQCTATEQLTLFHKDFPENGSLEAQACAVWNGQVFVFGGWVVFGPMSDSIWLCDPAVANSCDINGTFPDVSLSTPRCNINVVPLIGCMNDNFVALVGGGTGTTFPFTPVVEVEIFDLENRRMAPTMPSLLQPLASFVAVYDPIDGRIFTFGGVLYEDGVCQVNDIQVTDPMGICNKLTTETPTNEPTQDPTQNPTQTPSTSPTRRITTESPTGSPTLPPSNVPSPSPLACNIATYSISMRVTYQASYDQTDQSQWKKVTHPILLGGESIISQNCLYWFKLEWTGNLVFYDLTDPREPLILCQTNTSLVNEYREDQLTADRIQLFFSANKLWLIEDKYPNVQMIQPEILWTTVAQTPNVGAPYRLIVTNDGFVSLRDGENNVLWSCPTESETTSTTVTVDVNVTEDEIIQTETDEDIGNQYLWLWILLAICVLCPCLVWLFYPEYQQREDEKQENTAMPVSHYDDEDIDGEHDETDDEDDKSDVDEDEMLANWAVETQGGDLVTHIELQQLHDTQYQKSVSGSRSTSSSPMILGDTIMGDGSETDEAEIMHPTQATTSGNEMKQTRRQRQLESDVYAAVMHSDIEGEIPE